MRIQGSARSSSHTPPNRQKGAGVCKPLQRKGTEPATTSETDLFRTLPPNLYSPGPPVPGFCRVLVQRLDLPVGLLYASGLATFLLVAHKLVALSGRLSPSVQLQLLLISKLSRPSRVTGDLLLQCFRLQNMSKLRLSNTMAASVGLRYSKNEAICKDQHNSDNTNN